MKKQTLSSAKKNAWKYFSAFKRKQASNSRGMVTCYTCGKEKHWKQIQTGHWIAGHSNAVYINEDYVRPQCYSCNVMKAGDQGTFRDKIRRELGDKVVDQLIEDAHKIVKYTVQDYQELARYYKAEFEKLN